MSTLRIGDHSIQVDDSFLKLSPEQQNATVEEIAQSLPKVAAKAPEQKAKPALSDAVTDIPNEIGNAASENLQAIKQGLLPSGQGARGPIDNLLATGRGVAAIPGLLMSPITGAARSLIGHPMAQAEHAVGSLIAPETAAKDDPQAMYERAKGDADLAMAAAGSRGRPASVATPVQAPARVPTVQELKAAASAGYESPQVAGLEVKPESFSNLGTGTKLKLNDAGFDENLAPKTFGILSKVENIPQDAAVVTGRNIESLRKMLGKAAGSIDPQERAAASRALKELTDYSENIAAGDVLKGDASAAAQTIKEANANYSAAKQAENIDNKTIQAEIRAAASNSGQNVANTVRQRMADVVLKPKESRGLTADELAMAEEISRGTKTQNVIRATGNLLGGGGGLGAVAAAAAGGFATGGPGALAPLAGFLLKGISNRMTLSQASKLSEAIRSRAPLASSAQKFEESASALTNRGDPKAIAGVMIAARNLSTNLKSAGFNVSPADLLGGIQSPGTGNAQDQDPVPRPPGQ